MGKSTIDVPFSIAMLNYQRVNHEKKNVFCLLCFLKRISIKGDEMMSHDLAVRHLKPF
jgi:hypothetical protein